MEILIGADPEVFVKQGGVFVSGHTLIPGTKRDPFMVPKGAVQVDGVALEFNIFPAESEDEFVGNVTTVMSILGMMIPDDHEIVISPTAHFDPGYFNDLPQEPKLLGCEPDYDAYTGKINPKPQTDRPMRTGAGHIHIGWTAGRQADDPGHFETCREVVRALDSTLFPMSMEWDSDEERRELYGKMGSFRPKHFGVEYRPLSNAWLRDEALMRKVYSTTVDVVRGYFTMREEMTRAA